MLLTNDELVWLNKYYHGLKFIDKDFGFIVGDLQFDMIYDDVDEKYILFPDNDSNSQSMRIIDSYQIEIILQNPENGQLPIVKETGGRIIDVAQKKNLPLIDLHYPNERACLCFFFEKEYFLPNGLNIPDFINRLVVPFFYAQSYYSENNKWPWGQYEHGLLALFEWYSDCKTAITEDILKQALYYLDLAKKREDKYAKIIIPLLCGRRKIKGHHDCFCGSGRKFRDCHPSILRGLWKMKRDVYVLIK